MGRGVRGSEVHAGFVAPTIAVGRTLKKIPVDSQRTLRMPVRAPMNVP